MNVHITDPTETIARGFPPVPAQPRQKPMATAKINIEMTSPKDHNKLKAMISPIYLIKNFDIITAMKNPPSNATIRSMILLIVNNPLPSAAFLPD